jgi:hypothetical protein
MASPLAVPTALGVTSLLAAGTFALSFAVDPAEPVTFSDLDLVDPDGIPYDQFEHADFLVFMEPDSAVDDVNAVRAALDASELVDGYVYFDNAAAYAEFTQIFADKPELIESVAPEVLPPSFRVEVSGGSDAAIAEAGAPFEPMDGVRDVTYASAPVRSARTLADPAFLDRNSDWVLRAVAAAMLVPIALLVVAVKRHPTLTTTIPTPEVH